MTIPLGILLPIIFSKKLDNFLSIFIVSISITTLTELIQLLTGRSADIDDIIANTLEALLGFSIYTIWKCIYFILKKHNNLSIDKYKTKVIISIMFIIIVSVPIVTLKILDKKNEFGYIYYGHIKPSNVEISDSVSGEETTSIIYKYVEKETLDNLQNRLLSASGFSGSFYLEDDTYILKDGNERAIFIYDHNKWSVMNNYGSNNSIDKSKLPSEKEAIDLATNYIEKFQISMNDVVFEEISNEYSDNSLHLIFKNVNNLPREELTLGNIMVNIGENGELLDITDNRVFCKYYKKVETISPRQSVDIALDIGRSEIDTTANVSDVQASYFFINETGFLIPTWKIQGSFIDGAGTKHLWTPNISAIK